MRAEHLQDGYQIRLEWGREGVAVLGAHAAVVVIVDVLSFSTAVDIAVERGGEILPMARDDPHAAHEAAAAGAALAGPRGHGGLTLSPSSLTALPARTRLALPSPNGATLCRLAAGTGATVLAGCLRNAAAIARTAQRLAGPDPIGLIPAGERWDLPGDPMRVAIEDLIGAGAIAAVLAGAASPETELAAKQFDAARRLGLPGALAASASGRELIGDGFGDDVALAAEHNASEAAPELRGGILRA